MASAEMLRSTARLAEVQLDLVGPVMHAEVARIRSIVEADFASRELPLTVDTLTAFLLGTSAHAQLTGRKHDTAHLLVAAVGSSLAASILDGSIAPPEPP